MIYRRKRIIPDVRLIGLNGIFISLWCPDEDWGAALSA